MSRERIHEVAIEQVPNRKFSVVEMWKERNREMGVREGQGVNEGNGAKG